MVCQVCRFAGLALAKPYARVTSSHCAQETDPRCHLPLRSCIPPLSQCLNVASLPPRPCSYPCEWRPDNSIVVLDEIVINAPYTPDACSGKDAALLERVKLVVCMLSLRVHRDDL